MKIPFLPEEMKYPPPLDPDTLPERRSPPIPRRVSSRGRQRGIVAAGRGRKSIASGQARTQVRRGDPASGLSNKRVVRFQEAIRNFLEYVDDFCTDRRIWFDEEDRFIHYTATKPEQWQDFVELRSVLEEVAKCFLFLGKWDQAFRYATRGVSVGRHLLTRFNGSYSGKEMKAGDVICRLVRACVQIGRGDLGASVREIDLAKSLAAAGGGRRSPGGASRDS